MLESENQNSELIVECHILQYCTMHASIISVTKITLFIVNMFDSDEEKKAPGDLCNVEVCCDHGNGESNLVQRQLREALDLTNETLVLKVG